MDRIESPCSLADTPPARFRGSPAAVVGASPEATQASPKTRQGTPGPGSPESGRRLSQLCN